jgi:hypothetical protein
MNALKEKWLDVSERDNFRELEAIVAKGIKSFIVVGNALKEIRDSKLYREHYKTFEKYVSERWKINRQRAYQLIEAAEAKSNLSKILDKNKTADAINTESQLRELKDVPSESMEAVVDKAAALAGSDKITASDLKQARQEVLSDAIKTIAKDDELVFRDVDDDDDAPVIAPSLPVKQKPASKPKKSGCKNCERLSEELKQVRERLNRAMKTCSEQVTVMSDQATLISDLVDSKEQVSTVAKPSKQKPAGWLSAQEVVVSH